MNLSTPNRTETKERILVAITEGSLLVGLVESTRLVRLGHHVCIAASLEKLDKRELKKMLLLLLPLVLPIVREDFF